MKEKFLLYKKNCKLWPWNSCMTEHIHWTMTRSKINNCKIAQKHSNQWENAINGETCLLKESVYESCYLSFLSPPPPPTSAESGGPLLVPHHLNPLSLWKMYPLDLGIGNHGLKTCIIGLSREIFSRQTLQIKVPPSPIKWEHTCYPFVFSRGADFS